MTCLCDHPDELHALSGECMACVCTYFTPMPEDEPERWPGWGDFEPPRAA